MANEVTELDDACLWGPTVEKILIDIMIEEVNTENMRNGQFNSNTWSKILEKLQSQSKRMFSMKQIKQKYNGLRTKYREFTELLKQTGFGWDRETNTVTATEEIWQNYLRAHPKASQYRKKGCDHFILLELIFNKPTATGSFHRVAGEGPPNTDDERELEGEFGQKDIRNNDDHDSTSCTGARLMDEVFNRSSKHSETTSAERRSKKNRSQQMTNALLAWTEVAKIKTNACLAKAEKYKKSPNAEGNSQKEEFSPTKCVQIIERMEGIDDDVNMKAVEKFKDPDWREIFVNMSTLRKRAWLDRL